MSPGSAYTMPPPFRSNVAIPTYMPPVCQTSVGPSAETVQGPAWKHQLYNFSITPPAPPSVGAFGKYPLPITTPSVLSAPSTQLGASALSKPSDMPNYSTAHALDPRLVPLPTTSDADLLHGPTIAEATGHSAALKVAGSRRPIRSYTASPQPTQNKDKGKRKRDDLSDVEDLSDLEEPPKNTHGGRRLGAGNYGEPELKELLRLVESVLPFGQTGWQQVHSRYTTWATKNNKPLRDAKGLENKFKTLVRTRKPTGTAKRPRSVTRAKAIDKLISEKLATRNINDDDDVDDLNEARLSGDEAAVEDEEPVHNVVARSDRSATLQRRRGRQLQSTELSQKLAAALDPETQRLRDEERAARSLQNTQIFTISQQLRDSNAANDVLRRENADLRDRLYQTTRQCDRLDVELNLERRMSVLAPQAHNRPRRTEHKYNPDLVRVRGKIRHDEYFSDGGQYTTWITDGSSASDWEQDKENFPPRSPRFHPYARSASTWSPRPPSAPRALRSPVKGPSRGLHSPAARHSGFQSPIHSTFHSPKRATFRTPVQGAYSPVKRAFHPESQPFSGSQHRMKQPTLPHSSSKSPSSVCKPQHRKFFNTTHTLPPVTAPSPDITLPAANMSTTTAGNTTL